MDSITQAVLGAVIGRSLTKKAGITPLVVGALAGTGPDLDVIISPFISDVSSLVEHRSLTHSLLLCFPAAWLFARLLGNWKLERKEWFWILFWCFVTHILLDLCTNYGTQIFWPISRYPFALSTIFIVDPFYSLPLVVAFFYYLFQSREKAVKRNFAYTVLLLSSFYLLLGGAFKIWAQIECQKSLQQKGITTTSFIVQAAPLTIFQWTAIAVDKKGDRYAWFSVFHPKRKIDWQFMPKLKNAEEIENLLSANRDFLRLKNFSKGLYRIEKNNGKYYFYDLRFKAAFSFILAAEDRNGKLQVFPEITRDLERKNSISFKKRWREWLTRF